MNKLFLLPVILMACVCMLTSCEKEKVAEMIENNAANTHKPANFVLIQKGYVNENGFVGDLYYNESDPKCRCLVLYQQQTRDQPPTWTGKLETIYVEPGNPDSGIHSFFCDETKDPTDCTTTSNGGFETSVNIPEILIKP